MSLALVEKPNQVMPSVSDLARKFSGIRDSKFFDWIGLNKPSICALHSLAVSTIKITSAGLLDPSLFKRSIRALSSASIRLILMPVCFVKLL